MSTEPDLHDLATAYAINAVTDDERVVFEAHLVGCKRCQAEVAEATEVAAALAEDAATTPPPSLRDNVLASISQTEQEPPVAPPADLTSHRSERRTSRRKAPAWPLAVAAAVIVLAAASYQLLRPDSLGDDQIDIDDVAASSDSVALELARAAADSGTVRVVWSADLDVVSVVADDLVDPGPGQVYELWFLLDDGAVAPAGLFSPTDGLFSGVLAVDGLDALGWGLTIEPESGSEQPTGEILYLGEL